MEVKLTVKDRILLYSEVKHIKPKDIIEEMIKDSISEKIKFSDKEVEKYNITVSFGGYNWKENAEIKISLTNRELYLLSKYFYSIDNISDEIFNICKKLNII